MSSGSSAGRVQGERAGQGRRMTVRKGLGVQPGYLAAFRVGDLSGDPCTGILAALVLDINNMTGPLAGRSWPRAGH